MDNLTPTLFIDLNVVLREFVTRVRGILADSFVGAYLQGSFAVGDFDSHSDVDWTVVIERELTGEQVAALQVMHGQLYDLDSPWAQHLEGSYFPRGVLKALPLPETRLWYLDNGSRELILSDHCNTVVVRWVVREKGITLAGPPPETLVVPVSADVLRADIRHTILDWGREILAEPDHYANRFYQGFITLSYCRMLHDLQMGVNNSKRAGAEWAKTHLDPRWIGLIDGAWATRPQPEVSVRSPADPEAFAQTLEFVRYVMDESAGYPHEGALG